MQDIFRYIDDHLNESLAELTELCKLPTVSAQKSAIGETAEHVCGLLRDLGFEAQILPKRPPITGNGHSLWDIMRLGAGRGSRHDDRGTIACGRYCDRSGCNCTCDRVR